MNNRFSNIRIIFTILAGILCSTTVHASPTVAPGWDLFQTQPGTMIAGVSFEGVPLGNFDFGGTIGVKSVGGTDTIVQRLAAATVPGPVPPSATAAPIPIQLDAIQLESTSQVNMGFGLGYYFVTLHNSSPLTGGPPDTGTMSITFNRDPSSPLNASPVGSFSSNLTFSYDLRLGCLTCAVVQTTPVTLSSSGTPWGNFPPAGAIQISGVNTLLNGVDRSQDFWPAAPVPEPETYGMMLIGLGLLGFMVRRKNNA